MKIKSLTPKTALEVQPTDMFLIEDQEDTKQISAEELAKYLFENNIANEIITTVVNRILAGEIIP